MLTKNRQKPFLKWAGNKFRIIEHIGRKLPKGKRLIEPFSGSAAVFFNSSFKSYIIADTNHDLINLFQHIQQEGSDFIEYCNDFFGEKNNDPEIYYEFRKEFNKTDDSRLKAALFLYLNKHGYNGLCRYNQSGGFNVPFGKFKNPYMPKNEMEYFFEKSQNAEFFNQDFVTTMGMAKKGDVVYCDPPYVPLNATNSSFQYEKNGFSKTDQIELARQAKKLARKGIPVLISNHHTDFTQEIYDGADMEILYVQRSISCKGDNREKAREVLALFN